MQPFNPLLQPCEPFPSLAPFRAFRCAAKSRILRDLRRIIFRRRGGRRRRIGCVRAIIPILELLRINSDFQIGQTQSNPRRLGERGTMERESQAPDIDLDAVSGSVRNAAERKVTDSLNGDSGRNAYEGEDDKGGDVQ